MKFKGALLLCLLLVGCDKPNDTQLVTETGRELQRTIDTSPMRSTCEKSAKGREWLSRNTVRKLQAQGCDQVFRSATETNFTDTTIAGSAPAGIYRIPLSPAPPATVVTQQTASSGQFSNMRRRLESTLVSRNC